MAKTVLWRRTREPELRVRPLAPLIVALVKGGRHCCGARKYDTHRWQAATARRSFFCSPAQNARVKMVTGDADADAAASYVKQPFAACQ